MAQKPETKFRNRIRPLIEQLPNTVVFSVQQVALRGHPDLLICCSGIFIALELKKDKHTPPEPLQAYNVSRITKARGLAFVVHPDNWEEIYGYLKEISLHHYPGIDSVEKIN